MPPSFLSSDRVIVKIWSDLRLCPRDSLHNSKDLRLTPSFHYRIPTQPTELNKIRLPSVKMSSAPHQMTWNYMSSAPYQMTWNGMARFLFLPLKSGPRRPHFASSFIWAFPFSRIHSPNSRLTLSFLFFSLVSLQWLTTH